MTSCELPGTVIYTNDGGGFGVFGIGVQFGEITVGQHSTTDRWLRDRARMRVLRRS